MLLYRDLLTLQVGQESKIVYRHKIEELKQQALQTTRKKAIYRLEVILKAKNKLNSNMNLQLLMEQLVLDLQEDKSLYDVVGVRFKKAGKIYYFDPGELTIPDGEFVIVETVRGVEFGRVVINKKQVSEHDVVLPLKKSNPHCRTKRQADCG